MRWKNTLFLAMAMLMLWSSSGIFAAGPPAGEEYSRSTGGALRVRLAPAAPHSPPLIPKNLADLRSMTGDDFLCVQRDRFLVASDLGPGEYEYLVDGVLDFCRNALSRVYFDNVKSPAKTVNIFIFRDYTSYEHGIRRFLGMEPITPYGHYGHSQKYIVVNYDTGPGTMVHELTHALMSDDFPEAPIWLAEGMASLYEHCRAEGDVLRGDDNWRLPELKAALEGGYLTPLQTLFAMTPQTFNSVKVSLNYAQTRYFCKYMEELGLLPIVYKDFRARPFLDPTGGKFVAKAFGKPLESVEAAWRNWISFQYWKE